MRRASVQPCTVTMARRALIVQRVLVDGWSTAEAASAFGVSKRLVDVWVANYRLHGMASLRRSSGETLASQIVQLTIWQPIRGLVGRGAAAIRRLFIRNRTPELLALHRPNEELGGE
ncbi:MAG: helix-turn-helix domain-containing protein [Alphaproteobacteria bacterium]|nr:helix-turn-helix domain-containing protein [Alphaproteobacteria bacterium]